MENITFGSPVTNATVAVTNTYTHVHTASTLISTHHYRGELSQLSEQSNSVPPTL